MTYLKTAVEINISANIRIVDVSSGNSEMEVINALPITITAGITNDKIIIILPENMSELHKEQFKPVAAYFLDKISIGKAIKL